MTRREATATLLAVLMVVGITAAAVVFGAATAPVAADEHTYETAKDYTEEANFTVEFPYDTDHYPGDQNTENGSIEYYATGADAMRAVGAEEGAFINYVIIDASWIDYSACSTENTAAFGIDRGGNNSGTKIDEDLIEHQEKVDFRDDGITVNFLDWEDIANDPPYGAPEDQIVAAQGAGSNAGPCLTVTSEPGWYQLQGFINGTEADNGPNQEPSENANDAGIKARSNYLYVCECENEQEAEAQLGPRPGTETTPTPSGEESTPTPTPAGTPTPTSTPDPGGDEQVATATPTPDGGDDATATPTATAAGDDGPTNQTPTAGSGPGFTGLLALGSLLAGALLLRRRR